MCEQITHVGGMCEQTNDETDRREKYDLHIIDDSEGRVAMRGLLLPCLYYFQICDLSISHSNDMVEK